MIIPINLRSVDELNGLGDAALGAMRSLKDLNGPVEIRQAPFEGLPHFFGSRARRCPICLRQIALEKPADLDFTGYSAICNFSAPIWV